MHNEMAKTAYDEVYNVMKTEGKAKEFRSLARSFPSMLQVNGLGASLAFLQAKNDIAKVELYQMISNWIEKKYCKEKGFDLLKEILETESYEYRLYMDEIMRFCVWTKRFAEGMGEKDG